MVKTLLVAGAIVFVALMYMTPEEFTVARKHAAKASGATATMVKDVAVAMDKRVQKAVDED